MILSQNPRFTHRQDDLASDSSLHDVYADATDLGGVLLYGGALR